MELLDQLKFFTALDAVAVGLLLIAWIGIGFVIENPPQNIAPPRTSWPIIAANGWCR